MTGKWVRALQAYTKLFRARAHHPIALRKLAPPQLEDFRSHGYVVLDHFISKDAAAKIRREAVRLHGLGRLVKQLHPSGGVHVAAPSPSRASSAAGLHAANLPSTSSSSHMAAASLPDAPDASLQDLLQQQERPQPPPAAGSAASQYQAADEEASTFRSGSAGAPNGHLATHPPASSSVAVHDTEGVRIEYALPLKLGQAPADSQALATALVALQELQVSSLMLGALAMRLCCAAVNEYEPLDLNSQLNVTSSRKYKCKCNRCGCFLLYLPLCAQAADALAYIYVFCSNQVLSGGPPVAFQPLLNPPPPLRAQEDLSEILRLKHHTEYQLALVPPGAASTGKRCDADWSDTPPCRVTAVLFCGGEWDKEQVGGPLD